MPDQAKESVRPKRAPAKRTTPPAALIPQNQVEREFVQLIDYCKNQGLEGMKAAIKQNLRYRASTDLQRYNIMVDYYNKYRFLWGGFDPQVGLYELVDNRADALFTHGEDYRWLFDQLADYHSKVILLCLLSFWLSSDYKMIARIQNGTFEQYFDLDLVRCDPNEVFVDIGAYIGDTLVSYTKVFGAECFKRIYCYEIVPANIEYIHKNIELFHLRNVVVREVGAAEQSGEFFLSRNVVSSVDRLEESGDIRVQTVSVDEDITEPVSFIKMDIEGGEELALMGCLETIRKHHPKLALSAYHNHKDLWKLARIIHEADPTYKFYLRYYGGNLLPTEYVLYAI